MNQFLQDVLNGLQSTPKYLQSKYFYDKTGDDLFQKIMYCDEYYLTNCEMEIFSTQTSQIADIIIDQHRNFDVVELGPGDAVKSVYLLKELLNKKAVSTYFPVDISNNIIDLLHKKLPESVKMPVLRFKLFMLIPALYILAICIGMSYITYIPQIDKGAFY